VWLRTSSSAGYANDKRAVRIVSRSLLHGFRAEPMPAVQIVVALDDDRVLPGIRRVK
jgi:hypothetical protein